jgi:transposase
MTTKAELAERLERVKQVMGDNPRPRDVARALGVPFQTAVFDLRRLGVAPGKQGKRKGDRHAGTAEFHGRVLRAVQADPSRSLRAIGADFGISGEAVRLIIQWAGLPPKPDAKRGPAERTDPQKLAVTLALRQRGMSFRDIGAELGIGTMTAYKRVQRAKALGIEVRL